MRILSVLIGTATLMFVNCGRENHVVDRPVPVEVPGGTTPTPGPAPGDKISYQQMQSYMVNYCQACHSTAGFMQSEAALKSGAVENQLKSRRMPPSNASKPLPENTRTIMVNYF